MQHDTHTKETQQHQESRLSPGSVLHTGRLGMITCGTILQSERRSPKHICAAETDEVRRQREVGVDRSHPRDRQGGRMPKLICL